MNKRGTLILAAILILFAIIRAVNGDWGSLFYWGIIIVLVVIVGVINYLITYRKALHKLRSESQQDSAQGDSLTALVFLLAQPRALTEDGIRACAEQALGARFAVGNSEAQEFVVALPTEQLAAQHIGHPGQSFLLKVSQGMFLINSFSGTYMPAPEEIAAQLTDERLKRVITMHQAWLSVDLMHDFSGDATTAAAYRTIGKLLAAFADTDCLGVFCPELQRCNELDAEALAVLAGDNPLSLFDRSTNVPIINVADDDPRLLAATAEATRRWPEFVAAFTARRPGDEHFSIKAKFTQDGNTEHMWVQVEQLTEAGVTGLLGNDPAQLAHLKLGDMVTVPLGDIEDWLYVDGKEMVGGFSVKVMQEIMEAGSTLE